MTDPTGNIKFDSKINSSGDEYSGTLTKCIKGGVSLGNPLHIHGGNVKFPFNILLGAGVKKTVSECFGICRVVGILGLLYVKSSC